MQRINAKDPSGLQDALAKVKPSLSIEMWRACIGHALDSIDDDDENRRDQMVNILLSYKGNSQDDQHRILLLHEITREEGRLREDENRDTDDDPPHCYLIAQALLEKFPHLTWNTHQTTGRTVFHEAAHCGAHHILALAMTVAERESRGSAIDSLENTGQTPLSLAVQHGKLQAAQELMKDGRSLNVSEDHLRSAISGGILPLVELLLINRKHLVTQHVLSMAITSNQQDILNHLLTISPTHLENSDLLHHAVEGGQTKIVKSLVTRYPKLTAHTDKQERSVLFYNNKHETTTKAEIRKLIIPVIISANPPSVIRKLLKDTSGQSSKPVDDTRSLTH